MVESKQFGLRGLNAAIELFQRHGYHTWQTSGIPDFEAVRADMKAFYVVVARQSEMKHATTALDKVPFNLEHCTLLVMARVKYGGWRVMVKNTLGWAELGSIDDILG